MEIIQYSEYIQYQTTKSFPHFYIYLFANFKPLSRNVWIKFNQKEKKTK